jgi:HEAT repeat protein
MPKDLFYLRLLAQCQSPDLGHSLDALEDLRQHEYLDLIPAQFLLDRLNSTSDWQEQTAILRLMCEIVAPLPTEALMTILEDQETSSSFLRAHVAHTLAAIQAEDAIDLVLRLIADPHEEVYLREVLIGDLALWGEHIPRAFLLTLLDDPELCAAALDMWRSQPSHAIPLERILPYCTHEEKYLREAAIKTLLAAERLCPPGPILTALHDPESEVRTADSYGCISLAERFGDQIPVEQLLSALHDEYPPVRENILDALGKIPLRIPVEPVAAALTDATCFSFIVH